MKTIPFRLPRFLAFSLALLVSVAHAQAPRLANLSTKGTVSSGANMLSTGFVVGPGPGLTVLIRAVGPTLKAFGETTPLPDPVLTLFSGQNAIGGNSAWNASDAASMSAAGAFALNAGSKDCAIVKTLPAGVYTAQVSPASNDSGVAMIEIYEVSPTTASSHLINLSSSLFVSTTGASAGLTVTAGSGTRTVLVRAVGPTLGATFGVANVLADPVLALNDATSGALLASNDNWGTPAGTNPASAAALSTAFSSYTGFPLLAGSKDSAIIAVVSPGRYTVNVTGSAKTTGIAMVEVYDITPSGPTSVSLAATQPNADSSGGNPGAFTVTRTGDTSQPLTVNYAVTGSAVPDGDYASLAGFVTIPAGSATATIAVTPNPKIATGSTSVVLTLANSTAYSISGTGAATVTITSVPATLYLAKLNSPSGSSSTASGTAAIFLSPDGSTATVNITFSGLSSAENVAHLVIGAPGSGTFVNLTLPYGQVSGVSWTFSPTGSYSSAALLQALKSGQIAVEIDSLNYPTGELTGQFLQANGSQKFVAPAAAPPFDLTKITQVDASRFLTQATFGPSMPDITNLINVGYTQWISSQMALPASLHLNATRADAAAFPNTGQLAITQNNRQAAWWNLAVNAPDQLRQRVAFALSEMFVVSDVASSLVQQPEALANYYDLLAADAFGNYRKLIEDVTLSPVMGNYLNMLRSRAAIPASGISADENYGREIMQLFTVGLNQLNPDGSLQLDGTGLPIPTYNQATIVQTANVFTGWSYHSTSANPSFTGGAADWYNPMQLYPAFHDNTQKTVLGGAIIPANQGGTADLRMMLDTLANHPNAGPFFVRGLIQRLVTSNPSPGYLYRVSQVFANDGTGTRGNIGAVVKAILLDYEARSPAVSQDAGFGKLKEPLLRQTGLYRAFHAAAANGRFGIAALFTPDQQVGQAALRSPTVFNFFLPDFVLPGALAQAGLYGPEFQITTATTAISDPNYFYQTIFTSATPAATQPVLDFSSLTGAPDNQTMVSTINLLIAGGNMPASAQQVIVAGLNALPVGTTALSKAQYALYLAATSPAGSIQQ